MADFELVMPKMGESIMEATILKWLKKEGDPVEEDETIVEIATDKVDSEIPSPVAGVIRELLFAEDAVVEVGKPIARIAVNADSKLLIDPSDNNGEDQLEEQITASRQEEDGEVSSKKAGPNIVERRKTLPPLHKGRFFSPLVRSIAQQESLSLEELETIPGSGLHGRVTKKDLLQHLAGRRAKPTSTPQSEIPKASWEPAKPQLEPTATSSGQEEILEMDRMRKMIADHMVRSKQTAPHVTSFVEADVTEVVRWRDKEKAAFQAQYQGKLTFTPIFIYAVAQAIRDFPMINVSVDGHKIIVKKHINIGMATALPSGNLIVPVIKDADHYSVTGLANIVNDLAARARKNDLKPDEVQGGTFTVTNVGSFGNVMGTPIINQPEVAILATGAIRKKPAVVETEYGDLVAVRHMVFLSLSYDHRIVDGFLGGSFLRRVADYLESFHNDLQH